MTPMTQTDIARLLDTHGADPRHWPEDVRITAELMIEADPAALLDPASDALAEAVERSIVVKAGVVSGDLREATSVGSISTMVMSE